MIRPNKLKKRPVDRSNLRHSTSGEAHAAHFLKTVLTPAVPEGATVWDAAGQWRAPNGDLVRERSFVVELVHVARPEVEVRVQHVMAEYKLRFAQQSVLRLVTTGWAGS
jgi:hypothetical protein